MLPNQLVKQLEGVFKDEGIENPYFNTWWNELKNLVKEAYPELQNIFVGGKFSMLDKTGKEIQVKVTKENQKTWVMYELEGSNRPGCRWMVHKTWCEKDKIWPISSTAEIPFGTKIK